MVDAADLKSVGSNTVPVQVWPGAFLHFKPILRRIGFFYWGNGGMWAFKVWADMVR